MSPFQNRSGFRYPLIDIDEGWVRKRRYLSMKEERVSQRIRVIRINSKFDPLFLSRMLRSHDCHHGFIGSTNDRRSESALRT